MPKPVVIIHGWSDNSESFVELANLIENELKTDVTIINLADWNSMHDDITYEDISFAMQRAWIANNLPETSRAVDIISHSTGALVVREWMTKHYQPTTVPINRHVMLAPANFGSPLAHKGRSFIGRAIKGWGNDGFQTGKVILKGLELASPYTVNLAKKDVFSSQSWYGKGNILATVLVGNTGYDGVRAIANEDGGDGTVRISTANINAAKLSLVLDENLSVKFSHLESINGKVAFGIVDRETHGSIHSSKNKSTKDIILKSLSVTDDGFADDFKWQSDLNSLCVSGQSKSKKFQNLVTVVSDNFGGKIEDYFIEFFRKEGSDAAFEKKFYSKVINTVHAYEDNTSYRSIYLNIDEFFDVFVEDDLYLSLTAMPVYTPGGAKKQPVGYINNGSQMDGLKINHADLRKYFKEHTTLIAEITIERKVDDSVFVLSKH